MIKIYQYAEKLNLDIGPAAEFIRTEFPDNSYLHPKAAAVCNGISLINDRMTAESENAVLSDPAGAVKKTADELFPVFRQWGVNLDEKDVTETLTRYTDMLVDITARETRDRIESVLWRETSTRTQALEPDSPGYRRLAYAAELLDELIGLQCSAETLTMTSRYDGTVFKATRVVAKVKTEQVLALSEGAMYEVRSIPESYYNRTKLVLTKIIKDLIVRTRLSGIECGRPHDPVIDALCERFVDGRTGLEAYLLHMAGQKGLSLDTWLSELSPVPEDLV